MLRTPCKANLLIGDVPFNLVQHKQCGVLCESSWRRFAIPPSFPLSSKRLAANHFVVVLAKLAPRKWQIPFCQEALFSGDFLGTSMALAHHKSQNEPVPNQSNLNMTYCLWFTVLLTTYLARRIRALSDANPNSTSRALPTRIRRADHFHNPWKLPEGLPILEASLLAWPTN